MLPEEWQGLRHLLLLCVLHEVEDLVSVVEVVNLVHHHLMQTSIQLLVLADHDYQFYPVQANFKLEAFPAELLPLTDYRQLIDQIQHQSFEAAVVLTPPAQSPFSLAYLCYLAKIPIRLGQSVEFGGGVLSHCFRPPLEPCEIADYHLHLLKSAGFPGLDSRQAAIAS